MIFNELNIFQLVSEVLRESYDNIFITKRDKANMPMTFPTVTVKEKDDNISARYITFDNIENVAIETFEFEIYSDLSDFQDRYNECVGISNVINNVMLGQGYSRIMNRPVPNVDENIERRILRYRKNSTY